MIRHDHLLRRVHRVRHVQRHQLQNVLRIHERLVLIPQLLYGLPRQIQFLRVRVNVLLLHA